MLQSFTICYERNINNKVYFKSKVIIERSRLSFETTERQKTQRFFNNVIDKLVDVTDFPQQITFNGAVPFEDIGFFIEVEVDCGRCDIYVKKQFRMELDSYFKNVLNSILKNGIDIDEAELVASQHTKLTYDMSQDILYDISEETTHKGIHKSNDIYDPWKDYGKSYNSLGEYRDKGNASTSSFDNLQNKSYNSAGDYQTKSYNSAGDYQTKSYNASNSLINNDARYSYNDHTKTYDTSNAYTYPSKEYNMNKDYDKNHKIYEDYAKNSVYSYKDKQEPSLPWKNDDKVFTQQNEYNLWEDIDKLDEVDYGDF